MFCSCSSAFGMHVTNDCYYWLLFCQFCSNLPGGGPRRHCIHGDLAVPPKFAIASTLIKPAAHLCRPALLGLGGYCCCPESLSRPVQACVQSVVEGLTGGAPVLATDGLPSETKRINDGVHTSPRCPNYSCHFLCKVSVVQDP